MYLLFLIISKLKIEVNSAYSFSSINCSKYPEIMIKLAKQKHASINKCYLSSECIAEESVDYNNSALF